VAYWLEWIIAALALVASIVMYLVTIIYLGPFIGGLFGLIVGFLTLVAVSAFGSLIVKWLEV